MNSPVVGPYSSIQKLFGDPDDYAYKLDKDTFADALPINMNWLYIQHHNFFHSVSIDYNTQKVYYSNNFLEKLQFGLFIHNNNTDSHDLHAAPESNQVTSILVIRYDTIRYDTICHI